jgi:hypothetical protein
MVRDDQGLLLFFGFQLAPALGEDFSPGAS